MLKLNFLFNRFSQIAVAICLYLIDTICMMNTMNCQMVAIHSGFHTVASVIYSGIYDDRLEVAESYRIMSKSIKF